MTPLSEIPSTRYVALIGHHGERLPGMRLVDGRIIVLDNGRVGPVDEAAIVTWEEL